MSEQHIKTAAGLRVDDSEINRPETIITYALNTVTEGLDGGFISYQTEGSNELCTTFPDGFKVIGRIPMPELNQTYFWLVNPSTGDCQIGYVPIDGCDYTAIIDDTGQDQKLNFSIDRPIHQIIPKTTNCSTQFYWADNNGRRYIDLDKLPWQEQYNPSNDFQPIVLTGVLDANKLRVQPLFDVPVGEGSVITTGGVLKTGVYQAAIAYSNSLGDTYTSYYNVSNPIGIFEDRATQDFNYETTKSIEFVVNNLDTSGLWEYFNIAIVKTVNNISSFELIGTFPVTAKQYKYLYTGAETSTIELTAADIFQKYQFYDMAEGAFMADDRMGWYGMAQSQKLNYQQIWSQVKTNWATTQIPYNSLQSYNNGINTEKYRGYMRDEVVALEGAFVLSDGECTDYFHIPGRPYTAFDIETVYGDDVITYDDACNPVDGLPRWKVYNTASLINTFPEYSTDDCYVGPHQWGNMAYWESEELYPNNPDIWGNLAGRPIRHHKMPDCLISPHYSEGGEFIYPLGIKIDVQSIFDAIASSGLTAEQKARIKGFKIARANRKGQESVIAKGIATNVGHYYNNEEQQEYLLANYPYNSLQPDPYFSTIQLQPHAGDSVDTRINYFPEENSHRFALHSPDLHFGSPTVSNEGEIFKIEQITYGTSKGHFVKVQKNAEYKFLKQETLAIGFAAGIASSIGLGLEFGFPQITVSLAVHPENFIPSFTSMLELLEKLTPYTNFGYAHHSIGHYDNYVQVGNQGNKQRRVNSNKYLIDGKQTVKDGSSTSLFNNFRRESLVYVGTSENLPYPTAYSSLVPTDTSRYTMASIGQHLYSQPAPEQVRERPINAYYASLKRSMPSQYGRMYSYETIDTGYFQILYNKDGTQKHSVPIVYGGDTFINRFGLKTKVSLFLDNTVGSPNGADINYDELGNYGYPQWWASTKAFNPVANTAIQNATANFLTVLGNPINLLLGGLPTFGTAYVLLIKVFEYVYQELAVKNINLDYVKNDHYYELGLMYLFVYGVPYFFVESTVNVDYRQATNDTNGNFYPRVNEGIPDDWLQEINVPIKHDNNYTYNATFSKQNKEDYFSHLKEDWDPDKECFYQFPNRAIWSDKSSLEEKKNNWLIYKPVNRKDFPKNFGRLVSMDRLADRLVLVRYENKSQLYNATTTIDTSIPLKANLGNDELFAAAPVDIGPNSSTGYAGSQHKFILLTDYGTIWIDALRGQIVLLNGTQDKDLGDLGFDKWFSRNLPMVLTKKFPELNKDNNYKYIGLHGVYDSTFHRAIFTKLDYEPEPEVKYNGQFYIGVEGEDSYQVVELGDPLYFCNKSWTLSYSFKTDSWVSYHSYRPNYYIGHTGYFQAGQNTDGTLWDHNTVFDSFHSYFGKDYPYILEYPFVYKTMDELLHGVRDYCSALKYTGEDTFHEPDGQLYFNKAEVYNRQQHSGTLELIPRSENDMSQRIGWPKFTSDTKQILVTKSDNYYQFNMITDLIGTKNQPFYTKSCDFGLSDKELDNSVIDYTYQPFKKAQMRAKDSRVRLILDNDTTFKLVSRFIIEDTQISYK